MGENVASDRPLIHVVGLGPAGPDLLTVGAMRVLDEVPHRYLRTTRHPAAVAVTDAQSFDSMYEVAASFGELYPAIVAALIDAAVEHGRIVYAVPGSPLVAERTVELLREQEVVAVEIEPSLSFLDLIWSRVGVDPLSAGPRLVDAHRFAVDAAGERGPLVVAQCDSRFILSDVKLAVPDDRSAPQGRAPQRMVTVLQRLGLPDEAVFDVAWDDLDRDVEPDHLTSLYISEFAAPVATELAQFAEQVSILRRECPWDRRQTHQSLQPYLIEESYEVLDSLEAVAALAEGDDGAEAYADLEEELGDLLFQVFLHSAIAAEDGWFDLSDVARGIHDKLRRRHPHVFADVETDDPDVVNRNWDQIKAAEKQRASTLDGIPKDLPALARAAKVRNKARKLGYTESDGTGDLVALAKAVQLTPARTTVAALIEVLLDRARLADIDAETALRSATTRLETTIRSAEAIAAETGVDLLTATPDASAKIWAQARHQTS